MDQEQSLAERVARLETLVAELQRSVERGGRVAGAGELAALAAGLAPEGSAHGAPPLAAAAAPGFGLAVESPAAVPPQTRPGVSADFLWDGEFWLNKLGIGLLLLGVALLFRYTIDQGWITPVVRVGFGLAVGTALLAAGLGLGRGQRRFTAVLLGGGVATYYIVGFAAFQLYGLVGHAAAFAAMAAVTLLAFIFAVRRDEVVLSLVGAIGGLGTPFLLYRGSGELRGVIIYTCVMLSWTVALYLYRGWRSVFWVSVLGGWAAFWISYIEGVPRSPGAALPSRQLLQAAIVYAWVLFWALPVGRQVFRDRRAARAASPDSKLSSSAEWDDGQMLHIHLLSVSAPLVALLLSRLVSGIDGVAWGWLTLGVAALYGVVAWAVHRASRPAAEAQLLAAAILALCGSVAALDGTALLVCVAAEGAALHLIARRLTGASATVVAHAAFGAVAAATTLRLLGGGLALPDRVADLTVLAAALAASFALRTRRERLVYRFSVHAAVLAWAWREYSALPNGAAYVTVVWGCYAVALLVAGLRWDVALLQRTAVGTLLLVVAKLFLVDLAALEASWRIFLFLGLGGAFLFLSYSLQSLWKPRPGATGG